MSESIPSKLPMPSGRLVPSTLLVSCFALPVFLSGLSGCSSDANASHVEAAASGSTGGSSTGDSPGVGGSVEFVPVFGAGMGPGPAPGTGGTVSGSGGAGPYALPAGYTKAEMGGSKLGPAVTTGNAGASSGAGASGAGAPGAGGAPSTGCGTAILGVVRDFKGVNEADGHPDFEAYAGGDASEGIVKDALGDDQKPVYNGSGPIIDAKNGQQTTSKMDFDQWYRATAKVNKPYEIYFYFQPGDKNVLTFQSKAFFPLDGQGWGNTPGSTHNFGFTTEVHTQFNYVGGETFKFTGDDDLWVFINGKLAIDLGGLHRETSKEIFLDKDAKKLGITVGKIYNLDLFHAERHTKESNFRVDTNLAFTNCGTIIEEPPVK